MISVFCGKLAEHVAGQSIPGGLLVTVPVPVPATVTDIVTFPGGGLATIPRQPASARVNSVDSNVNQNVYRDFIGELPLWRGGIWMKMSTGGLVLLPRMGDRLQRHANANALGPRGDRPFLELLVVAGWPWMACMIIH